MKKKRPRGNPKLDEIRNTDVSAANRKRTNLTDEHARTIMKAIIRVQNEMGHLTFGGYADWLNSQGYRTRRGYLFTGRQVSRIYDRFLSGKAKPKA